MVSAGAAQACPTKEAAAEPVSSSPRISFSSEFLDDKDFITISPKARVGGEAKTGDFEFLSSNASSADDMITADELFSGGKLLPFWQIQHAERLNGISLKTKDGAEAAAEEEVKSREGRRVVSWLVDDDPSPRPPKCTVLWKELLKLKKHRRASSLSPSSSSSYSSSSSSSSSSLAVDVEEGREGDQQAKRTKKGLERTRSASVRIRPMVNVPPLFPHRKGKLER